MTGPAVPREVLELLQSGRRTLLQVSVQQRDSVAQARQVGEAAACVVSGRPHAQVFPHLAKALQQLAGQSVECRVHGQG